MSALITDQIPLLSLFKNQSIAGFAWADYPSGKITHYNKAAEEILGHSLMDEWSGSGSSYYGGLHPDERPFLPEDYPLHRALSKDENIVGEKYLYLRRDGKKISLSVSATVVYDSSKVKVGVICFFQDVTALINPENRDPQVELVLRNTLKEIEKEKSMIGEYLRSIQAEIKTPMTSIKLNTLLLSPSASNQKKLSSIAVKIQDSLVKLSNYVSDMLNLQITHSGHAASNQTDVEFIELILEAIEDKKTKYRHSYHANLPEDFYVLGDREDLKRLIDIFLNFPVRFGSKGEVSQLHFKNDGDGGHLKLSLTGMNLKDEDLSSLMVSHAKISELQNPLNTKALTLLSGRHIAEAHRGKLVIENAKDEMFLYLQLPGLKS